MVMMVVGRGFVGSGLGLKGVIGFRNRQSPLLQEILKNRVGQKVQMGLGNFQGHMAVAEVIGGL
jgi:hypothetical protein